MIEYGVNEKIPLVFVHGWGMHGGLFEPLLEILPEHYQVHLLDLPGHGDNAFAADALNSEWLQTALATISAQQVVLLGWSLGAMLCMHYAAHFPQRVSKMVLLGATPCFVQRHSWPHAVAGEIFHIFAESMVKDQKAALARFIALQFYGAENEKQEIRQAREKLLSRPLPQPASLQQGLQILLQQDLRPLLPQITAPTLIVNGERDTLIPAAGLPIFTESLVRARAVLLAKCGHAPHLSHRQATRRFILDFLHD